MAEAIYLQNHDIIEFNASETLTDGQIIQLADGRAAVVSGGRGFASGDKATARVAGRFTVAKATGTAWEPGDVIWFDASANQAIKKTLAMDGDADFYLGVCQKAAASGDATGVIELNAKRPLDPIVFEFDCADGDTEDHVLLPAEMNPNGVVFWDCFGIVTEQMAGSSEDQGIITIEDEDDNALGTITAANAAADAIGDIVRCTGTCVGGASGDAAKTVAAGKAITGRVSQQTAGTAAGKFKVYLKVLPLV